MKARLPGCRPQLSTVCSTSCQMMEREARNQPPTVRERKQCVVTFAAEENRLERPEKSAS